jgi:hypothetical protein
MVEASHMRDTRSTRFLPGRHQVEHRDLGRVHMSPVNRKTRLSETCLTFVNA